MRESANANRTAKDAEVIRQSIETRDNNEQGGREIRGLEPKLERFSRLQEGADYKLSFVNEYVHANENINDYLVFVNPSGGDISLEIVPPHWRTITAPTQAYVKKDDNSKDYFFEANTKGVGYLKPSVKGGSIDDYENWHRQGFIEGERILGICSDLPGKRSAEKNANISERLINLGLRTELYWGIAELKRLPFHGEMLTIGQLQERGVFMRTNNGRRVRPIEIVRLLKNNTRVEEAYLADERRQQIFHHAFENYNTEAEALGEKELDVENQADQEKYFNSFCRHIGSNIAILLNEGLSHGALHSSNITMSAEFADLEPMVHWSQDTKISGWQEKYGGLRVAHLKDMRDAAYSLRRLFKAAREADLKTGSRENLVAAILEGFDAALDVAKAAGQGSEATDCRRWLAKIMERILVERGSLPSLQKSHISQWDISL